MTISKLDITAQLLERNRPSSGPYKEHWGGPLLVLKQAFVKLMLGQSMLRTWVLIANTR